MLASFWARWAVSVCREVWPGGRGEDDAGVLGRGFPEVPGIGIRQEIGSDAEMNVDPSWIWWPSAKCVWVTSHLDTREEFWTWKRGTFDVDLSTLQPERRTRWYK